MDLGKVKDILSQNYYLTLLFLAQISHTSGQNDVFNTKVVIDPASTTKGQEVTFSCTFTLVDEKDLHLLYWETTNGDRLFTYNNVDKTEKIHSPYKEEGKILEAEYYDDIRDPTLGEWDRRHTLKVKVDNCDRATYKCLVLNQGDFTEGFDQQTLEIQANLPNPVPCAKVDGKCHQTLVYRNDTTTITPSCTVTDSSVEPDITLMMKNGTALNLTQDITNLPGCLHNGVLESGEITVKKGEDAIFYCEVNYGGTKKKSEDFGVTFNNPCASEPCLNGGTCEVLSATTFRCECPENYYGDTCDNTACVDNPCHENSTCVAISNSNYECRCQGNNYGSYCVQTGCEYGACYCRNGGTCVDGAQSCNCQCDSCYTGEHCDDFAAGNLCSQCSAHASSCDQTCDGFKCHCDWNWNGTLCDQKCNIALGTSSPEGSHNVNLGGSRIFSCQSDDPRASVVWEKNGVTIATGQSLTFSPALLEDQGAYSCNLMSDHCKQRLEYSLTVDLPTYDVDIAENETTVSNTSRDAGEQLLLNCTVAKVTPLPWLYWLKLNDDQSKSFVQNNHTIKEKIHNILGKYVVLSNSSHGNVVYQVDVVVKEDEGHYVCVANQLDYQQTLKSTLLLVAGKTFSQ